MRCECECECECECSASAVRVPECKCSASAVRVPECECRSAGVLECRSAASASVDVSYTLRNAHTQHLSNDEIARLLVLIRPRYLHLRRHHLFLSAAFPMFVPSLPWQNDTLYVSMASQNWRFFTVRMYRHSNTRGASVTIGASTNRPGESAIETEQAQQAGRRQSRYIGQSRQSRQRRQVEGR